MVYRSKSKERKLLKQELMKIRDSEYTNFLLDQSENFKKIKTSGVKGINESLDENLEDGVDDSD